MPPILIGSLLLLLLLIPFFLFVAYQRKTIKNQVNLRKLGEVQQHELLKAVIETQESERKRLAEDLHDSIGQVLSAIKLKLHRLEKVVDGEDSTALLADTRQLTDECILEIRNIIHNVLPPVLTDFGLTDALKALCNKMNDNTPVRVTFHRKLPDERFPPEIELTLYRIAQELFGNAVKHSEATSIEVELSKQDHMLTLTFRDNGKGFDMEHVRHGFGLKNLRSRTNLIHGKVHIYSKPLNGTLTTIDVPLPKK